MLYGPCEYNKAKTGRVVWTGRTERGDQRLEVSPRNYRRNAPGSLRAEAEVGPNGNARYSVLRGGPQVRSNQSGTAK